MTDIINTIITGDCLVESDRIPSGSVDLILTDLPYGTVKGAKKNWNVKNESSHNWDIALKPADVYAVANRILRKNGKMVLFAQEPYTMRLITEAIPNLPYSYRAMWEKDDFANALGVNKNMVSYFEDVLIFSKRYCYEARNPLKDVFYEIYKKHEHEEIVNAVRTSGRFSTEDSIRLHSAIKFGYGSGIVFEFMVEDLFNHIKKTIEIPYEYRQLKEIDDKFKNTYSSTFNLWEGGKYKSNILRYKKDYNGYHPTQKPVLLLEDLIRTFSNEGNTVVDLTAGSGSTAVAAINTGRNFIAIEQDVKYVSIARQRISDALQTEHNGGERP